MPAFRRGGGNNSRGGRGGARGGARAARGGPRLPFTLTEELGLPSQKKSEFCFNRERVRGKGLIVLLSWYRGILSTI